MKYPPYLPWLCLVVGVVASTSCSINPATGSPDLVLMTQSREIEMGQEMHQKLLKTVPIYPDKRLAAYIDSIGQKVASNSHRPDIKYHFTIIDRADINAFALPGGYIYINRGLLAYLDSDAQLAAVLAHEIGHVTARHVVRQDTARKGANILSIFSVFATASAQVGDVTNLWSTAAVKGYGREMELEADGLGAQYLFNSGYDPHAMVETISLLKDQERFARYRAKNEGKKNRSYHGVFSSHPRNDVRLKKVIAQAGTFSDQHSKTTNQQQYREHIEGMVYGVNYEATLAKVTVEKNRYSHKNLGFTLLFPEQWLPHNSRSSITFSPENKSARLTLEVARHQQNRSPSQYLRRVADVTMLRRAENFSQYGLIGHTGIVPATADKSAQRIAVLFQGSRAYLFTGTVLHGDHDIDYDKLFLKTIHSFKPERTKARKTNSIKVDYVMANERTRIDALAKQLNIGAYAAQQIRLINGLYPGGEPKPGQWIKIVK